MVLYSKILPQTLYFVVLLFARVPRSSSAITVFSFFFFPSATFWVLPSKAYYIILFLTEVANLQL